MALLDSELARLKQELGFSLVSTANPFIGNTVLFEQIIQPYVTGGTATTSSTAVTAATTLTPVALTLASATGFSAGQRVVVDVDSRQEIATIQSISGAAITVHLKNAHTGTYPVTIEGPETIVREILRRIYAVKDEMAVTFGEGSLKKCDELEWYQSGVSLFGSLGTQLAFWREELAAALGIRSMWSLKRAAAQTLSVY